jgi:hypothetical protein
MEPDSEQSRSSLSRGDAVAGCLVWGGQVVVVAGSILVMSVTLKGH